MKIAILDDYLRLSQQLADWSPVGDRATITVLDRPLTMREAEVALGGFDVLCTLRERQPFPRELIERLPRLRYLCVTGKRYDTVDLVAASEHGVLVSNTPVTGAGAGGVAELTWGLILASTRHIAREDRLMRAGGWQHELGTTLRGTTLGIVGLGSIGADVGRIGRAFGMEVIAWSPNLSDERATAGGARLVTKTELFQTSDVISVHLALADSTRHVIGPRELAAMKRTARLVNTARAGLIDERALIDTLQRRGIAGAALDVFSIEPLPAAHALRSLENVVLTPHLGYFTREMLTAYYTFAIENILAFLDGRPIRLVTPD